MKKSLLTIVLLSACFIMAAYVFGSCKRNEFPGDLNYLPQQIPAGFPAPLYNFADNPVSQEGFDLGKKLFYDGRLSYDGHYPCSSCHQQIAAFGTFEHDRSHGYNGSHTLRNAPVLFNLAWQKDLHWDGKYNSLFEEAGQPINTHTEMAESFDGIIAKLQKDPEYRAAFRKVFRSDFIRPEYILKALAQFTGTLVSANSRYDRYKRGEVIFNAQEENGYATFKQKCASCHTEPMFTDYSYRNIGLPIDPLLNDYGRLGVTGNAADSFKFRVPTLRNVYISSNYMHDGRFATLAQCINHYRSGIQSSTTLDPSLKNGITLTNTEATNVALFLRTLTDSSFIGDARYR